MARRTGGRRGGSGRFRWRRPRSRTAGCLIWLLAVVVILLLLSLIFGGFQNGTKTGSGTAHRLQPAAQERALGGVAALI